MFEVLKDPVQERDIDQVLADIEKHAAPRDHHEGRDLLPSELEVEITEN